MSACVLAIDQGTTNTKVLLIDRLGRVAARGSAAVPVRYPRPGWAEQSGSEIWQSVVAAAEECLSAASGATVAAIGISNQRESVMLWRRDSGEPIGPCISWQCRRSADGLAGLSSDAAEFVQARTGLGLDPLFPAAKIGWLLDAYPEARSLAAAGDLCAGTVDSWLVFRLTGGHVHATDVGNASRTQLFNIHDCRWDDELCAMFGVPLAILPMVRASDADFGVTVGDGPLPARVAVRAVMGDSHAALFGHGIRKPGAAKATYGTGSSLMALTDGPVASRSGLSTTIAWQRGDSPQYALEGNIIVSAQAAMWVAGVLGLSDADALTALAETVSHSDGVYFVPTLAGLGAPRWKARARAAFVGMSLATQRGHLARATLEAIALQVRDVFAAMESDLGRALEVLSVDGGATRNDVLMQMQANVIGRPIRRPPVAELSALGAGIMAGVASGFADEAALSQSVVGGQAAAGGTFMPKMSTDERQQILAGWQAAVAGAIEASVRS